MDVWMMDSLNNVFFFSLPPLLFKTGVNGVCQTAHSGYGLGCFLSFGVMYPSYSV